MLRRWVWGVLALLVVVLAVFAVLLAADARAVQAHLAAVEDQLARARTAVTDGDVEAARSAVADARADAEAAAGRTDGPWWPLAEAVPRFGASAEAARTTVDLAAAATTLAAAVTDEATELIDAGAAAFVDEDGRIRTDDLRDLADRLDDLPVAPLADARDRLAALPASGLVGPALSGRDDAVALADDVQATLERTRLAMRSLSGFLGADGARTYLLAVQNPGELRGTGGLLAYLAELRIDQGQLSVRAAGVEAADDLDPLSRPGETQNSTSNLDPVPRPDAFAERYDHNAGGAILQSVNLDPDLPTVGPVLMDLYAARGGREVDGVVLVDPLALAAILEPTGGPLDVPAELRQGTEAIPEQLTAGNLAETLLVTVYDAFGGESPARRVFDETVTLRVLDRLTGGQWDPVALGHALGGAAAERHLQVHSADPDEQEAFEQLGLAGRVTPAGRGRDVLAVTGINAGADKSDVHVAHRISGQLVLSLGPGGTAEVLSRRAQVEVGVDNPLAPGEHDTYIVGTHHPAEDGSGSSRVDDGLNRTWFTIWTPPLTQLNALRDGVHDRPLRYSNIHGHRAIDYFLETEAESTNSFSVDVSTDVALRREGDAWVYELALWRQAKAIPDHWDLAVTAPSGWVVTDAAVTGGGEPTGMGAGGTDGESIGATVEGDTVRVRGAVTRDATLTVRLHRP